MKGRVPIAVALIAAVAALSGCSSTDEGKAGGVVAKYLDAIGDKRYTDACKLLATGARSGLGGDCADALDKKYESLTSTVRTDFNDIDVKTATVKGDTATIKPSDVRARRTRKRTSNGKTKTTTSYSTARDLTNGAGYTLTKSGDSWLIAGGI
jgi:type IV pilus biogenesis protein CpaD/CtpE